MPKPMFPGAVRLVEPTEKNCEGPGRIQRLSASMQVETRLCGSQSAAWAWLASEATARQGRSERSLRLSIARGAKAREKRAGGRACSTAGLSAAVTHDTAARRCYRAGWMAIQIPLLLASASPRRR